MVAKNCYLIGFNFFNICFCNVRLGTVFPRKIILLDFLLLFNTVIFLMQIEYIAKSITVGIVTSNLKTSEVTSVVSANSFQLTLL